MLLLAGCATTTDTAVIDRAASLTACQAFRPIAWSRLDTDQTILDVKSHNAAYAAICGKRTP